MPSPPFSGLLLALFTVSGALALVYESLWTRQLALVMGSTTYAIGTVLAAFMGGLGLGAWLLGRRADRTRRPLALYAALELAIGVLGLASPFVLAQGNGLYAVCYRLLEDRPTLLTFARFAIGFLFVAPPAFVMGGTLPVATRYLVRQPQGLGIAVGHLYALNTLGAAAGALLLPFALLPALGVRATLFVSGATNLGIGVVAWLAARAAPEAAVPDAAAPTPAARVARGLLLAFFLSGFVALALETVWNRFFSMYFGSSIYSYAIILALYLIGIVVGSELFVALARRGVDPRRVFAACLALLVVDLAITVPFMDRVLYVQLGVLDALGLAFPSFVVASAAAAVLVILPATILFGMSFPAVAAAAAEGPDRIGTDLGRVYLVNTAGTAAGALVASFVLLAGLGVRGSFALLALLAASAFAIVALGRAGERRRPLGAVALVAALAVVPAVTPAWDVRLMHTGFTQNPSIILDLWHAGGLPGRIAMEEPREVRDGVDVTAAVVSLNGFVSLFVNGKPDASDGLVDRFTQTVLAHLALSLHPDPHDVLVVGMGSGSTLAAVARYPVGKIDLIEVSPEVLALGDRYFTHINRGALHDSRVGVHVEDARNFIAFQSDRTYDAIVSEPSNPWMTGVANLFTDDFFAQLRSRLREDGILSQWFHYYSMELDDVRSLVGTLHRHLPYVYGFAFHDAELAGDLFLVASPAPLDFTRVLALFAGQGDTGADMQELGRASPDVLLGGLVLSPENVERFVGDARLNTDDRPHIELQAPRAVFESDRTTPNLSALLASSGGARLPIAPPASSRADGAFRTRKFEAVPPSGFRVAFNGFRIEVTGGTDQDMPSRTVLHEITFADDGGRRLELLNATLLPDQGDLERLASLAAGGAQVVPAGEATVAGHAGAVYHVPDTRTDVVTWSCPATGTSHAAAIIGRRSEDTLRIADVATGIRCHHD